MLRLIIQSAFSSTDASGAFLGGTFGYAFLWGMKRALFSNEAGQGSSPMAHAAAKTREPVREGIVAGLEPFVDTIVVCSLTALVVLSSGAWNRQPAAYYGPASQPRIVPIEGKPDIWTAEGNALPRKTPDEERISNAWRENDGVFLLVRGELDPQTGRDAHALTGTVVRNDDGSLSVLWHQLISSIEPRLVNNGLHLSLAGSALTAYAFDRVTPGLGMWLVTAASWLFAISTIISWAYYGEQGIVFLMGKRWVMPYKIIYCILIIVSCGGFIRTDVELDAWTALGTGVMLFANIPIMLLFGSQAMRAYHSYLHRLRAGEFKGHAYPVITDVIEGRDVE
jgi:AGCS family alanine or glycine:cation symporter